MSKIDNSCGSSGCKVRIILPNDRLVKRIPSRMLQVSHDTKEILPTPGVLLEKKAA